MLRKEMLSWVEMICLFVWSPGKLPGVKDQVFYFYILGK